MMKKEGLNKVTSLSENIITESKFGRAMGKFQDYASKVINILKRKGVSEKEDLALDLIATLFGSGLTATECANEYLKKNNSKIKIVESIQVKEALPYQGFYSDPNGDKFYKDKKGNVYTQVETGKVGRGTTQWYICTPSGEPDVPVHDEIIITESKKIIKESENYIPYKQLEIIAANAGAIVADAKETLLELGADYKGYIPISAIKDILYDYDLTYDDVSSSNNNRDDYFDDADVEEEMYYREQGLIESIMKESFGKNWNNKLDEFLLSNWNEANEKAIVRMIDKAKNKYSQFDDMLKTYIKSIFEKNRETLAATASEKFLNNLEDLLNEKLNETDLYSETDPYYGGREAENNAIHQADFYYKKGLELYNSGKKQSAERFRRLALKKGEYLGWNDSDLPPYANKMTEGKKRKLKELYNLGELYSDDFDYRGMLLSAKFSFATTPIKNLKKLAASFTDVNYHSVAVPLYAAIKQLENGDKEGASISLDKFRELASKELLEESKKIKNKKKSLKESGEWNEDLKVSKVVDSQTLILIDKENGEKSVWFKSPNFSGSTFSYKGVDYEFAHTLEPDEVFSENKKYKMSKKKLKESDSNQMWVEKFKNKKSIKEATEISEKVEKYLMGKGFKTVRVLSNGNIIMVKQNKTGSFHADIDVTNGEVNGVSLKEYLDNLEIKNNLKESTSRKKISETTLYSETDPTDGDADDVVDTRSESEYYYFKGLTLFKNGKEEKAEDFRKIALKIGGWLGWTEVEFPPYTNEMSEDLEENKKYKMKNKKVLKEEEIKWTPYLASAYAEGFDEGSDATPEEELQAWAYLIKTKLAWSLQGWYGRHAQDLIDRGVISKDGVILKKAVDDFEEKKKIKNKNKLNETGEWEDDEEGLSIKQALESEVGEIKQGLGKDFVINSIEGFDKYQGAYALCSYHLMNYKFWLMDNDELYEENTKLLGSALYFVKKLKASDKKRLASQNGKNIKESVNKNKLNETSHEIPTPKYIVNYEESDVVTAIRECFKKYEGVTCSKIAAVGETQFYNCEVNATVDEQYKNDIEASRFMLAQRMHKLRAELFTDLASVLPVVNINMGNYQYLKGDESIKFIFTILMSQTNQRDWVSGEYRQRDKDLTKKLTDIFNKKNEEDK